MLVDGIMQSSQFFAVSILQTWGIQDRSNVSLVYQTGAIIKLL
jgi:hypothetical protein